MIIKIIYYFWLNLIKIFFYRKMEIYEWNKIRDKNDHENNILNCLVSFK